MTPRTPSPTPPTPSQPSGGTTTVAKNPPVVLGATGTSGPGAGGGGSNAYLRTRVMTAGPMELRQMLLDGAVKFARQAREGLDKKDFEAVYLGVSQSRAIVVELMTSMGREVDSELAGKVRGLYSYIFSELTLASTEKDPSRLDRVIGLLEFERETWSLAVAKFGGQGKTAPAGAPGALGLSA